MAWKRVRGPARPPARPRYAPTFRHRVGSSVKRVRASSGTRVRPCRLMRSHPGRAGPGRTGGGRGLSASTFLLPGVRPPDARKKPGGKPGCCPARGPRDRIARRGLVSRQRSPVPSDSGRWLRGPHALQIKGQCSPIPGSGASPAAPLPSTPARPAPHPFGGAKAWRGARGNRRRLQREFSQGRTHTHPQRAQPRRCRRSFRFVAADPALAAPSLPRPAQEVGGGGGSGGSGGSVAAAGAEPGGAGAAAVRRVGYAAPAAPHPSATSASSASPTPGPRGEEPPFGQQDDSGGWTGGASTARPGGGGPEFTASGVPRETYGSWDLAFPPDIRPRAPPSPPLSTLRNHSNQKAELRRCV